MSRFYLRTEETSEAARTALARGRSADWWSHIGTTPIDWAYAVEDMDPDLPWRMAEAMGLDPYAEDIRSMRDLDMHPEVDPSALDAALVEDLGLERCDDGVGWWRPLPGLCALACSEEDLGEDTSAWLALVPRQDSFDRESLFRWLAVYEGEHAGYDRADWELFRPLRLVRVIENPAWDGKSARAVRVF